MSKEKDYSIQDTINKIKTIDDVDIGEEPWCYLSSIIQENIKKNGCLNLNEKNLNYDDWSNIREHGLYFVDTRCQESLEKFCDDTKAMINKQDTIDKLCFRVNEIYPEALNVSFGASGNIYNELCNALYAIVIKQCDDQDYYFNLGNLGLTDRDIYAIIEPEGLPAVLSKLITDQGQPLSFSFTFYGNTKISNEAANNFVSSVCSALPECVESNIDFCGCPKVHNILVQDQYKSSVRIMEDNQNNTMSNSTVDASECNIGSHQDVDDVCVTGSNTSSYDHD